MIQSDDFTEGGDRGFCIWANYKNTGKSRFECNDGVFRGDVYAKNGIFHGRIEADEGFFRGNLETPVLLATTTPILGQSRNYASGKSIVTVLQEEQASWGESGLTFTKTGFVQGTFNGKQMASIYFYYYSRGVPGSNNITITFKDGTTQTIYETSTLPQALIFTYSTGDWTVVMKNIPTSDPRIAGVVWRDGTDLKISVG